MNERKPNIGLGDNMSAKILARDYLERLERHNRFYTRLKNGIDFDQKPYRRHASRWIDLYHKFTDLPKHDAALMKEIAEIQDKPFARMPSNGYKAVLNRSPRERAVDHPEHVELPNGAIKVRGLTRHILESLLSREQYEMPVLEVLAEFYPGKDPNTAIKKFRELVRTINPRLLELKMTIGSYKNDQGMDICKLKEIDGNDDVNERERAATP